MISADQSTPTSGFSSFSDLALVPQIQRALDGLGYRQPTPIQAQAIPHLLDGRDLLGCAQTGTGKTAAFALPILDRLARQPRPADNRGPRALVLTPTRELALQVKDSFADYSAGLPTTTAVVFGGVGQGPQVAALRRGLDVLVATPGRLIDLMQQGHARLAHVEHLVLDEADRMLDMGFIQPIRKIVGALPARRQSALFSATLPGDILTLARGILRSPVQVSVRPAATTADNVAQWVLFVEKGNKLALLQKTLRDPAMTRVLIFTRTKHGANRLAKQLDRAGVAADAIHGNKSQGARQNALEAFRAGRARALVATDIAARGLDVDGITHVVNYDLPNEPESYVHRIGRTARAGARGIALSFCAADERPQLRDIRRLTRADIKVVDRHPFVPDWSRGAA